MARTDNATLQRAHRWAAAEYRRARVGHELSHPTHQSAQVLKLAEAKYTYDTTYGVDGFADNGRCIMYINTGDPYTPTLCHITPDHGRPYFTVACWGDLVRS